jgi:hypothetical protein
METRPSSVVGITIVHHLLLLTGDWTEASEQFGCLAFKIRYLKIEQPGYFDVIW